jgi:hypothetical protein
MQRDQVTALILAGGKATRMGGVDKRELVKASSLLTDEPLRVRWIEERELRAVDPHLRALHNVNAPEDMSP